MRRVWTGMLLQALAVAPLSVVARGDAADPPRFRLGTIEAPAVTESSGLVASRKHPGVFWTLNDSGNAPMLYAMTREGKAIREYPVAATNVDWEDLAIDGDGHLYVADTGNNAHERTSVQIYRVDEPDPTPPAPAGRPAPLRPTVTWGLTYPAAPFDCEAMFVLGHTGYLIPKRLTFTPAELYTFDLAPPAAAEPQPAKLRRVATLPAVRAPVTAAQMSADGKRLLVLTLLGPYVFDVNGDPAAAAAAVPRHYGYVSPRMEAACFVPEGVLATTETRDVFLFRDELFKAVDGKK